MQYTNDDLQELQYDIINGKPKPLLSILNKNVVSKTELDDLFLSEDFI